MTPTDIGEFHAACRAMVARCPDPYARSYADVGLGLTDPDYVRVQCLYILNNMGSWRGDAARQSRATFKALSKKQKGD